MFNENKYLFRKFVFSYNYCIKYTWLADSKNLDQLWELDQQLWELDQLIFPWPKSVEKHFLFQRLQTGKCCLADLMIYITRSWDVRSQPFPPADYLVSCRSISEEGYLSVMVF